MELEYARYGDGELYRAGDRYRPLLREYLDFRHRHDEQEHGESIFDRRDRNRLHDRECYLLYWRRRGHGTESHGEFCRRWFRNCVQFASRFGLRKHMQRELSERHCNHADGYAERVHVWKLVGLRLGVGSELHRDFEQRSFGSGDIQLAWPGRLLSVRVKFKLQNWQCLTLPTLNEALDRLVQLPFLAKGS